MHDRRFDALARLAAVSGSRRSLIRGLGSAALGAVFGSGWAGAVHAKGKEEKVTICHEGETITVASAAVHAHVAHGDTVGECQPTGCPPQTSQCGEGTCCADCFLSRNPDTGVETPFCCPAPMVCPGATSALEDDQCCYDDEQCFVPGTSCCRSNQDGTCTVVADCAGCCRTCGTDGAGHTLCCDQTEQCVTDGQTGAQTCESLNTARISRYRS